MLIKPVRDGQFAALVNIRNAVEAIAQRRLPRGDGDRVSGAAPKNFCRGGQAEAEISGSWDKIGGPRETRGTTCGYTLKRRAAGCRWSAGDVK